MNFHNMATVAVAIFALTFTTKSYSQTCMVKTATLNNGNAVYTEVFEYDYVDEKPEFPGGVNSLIKFINNNRQYPSQAYEAGIEGRVTCAFVVHPDGKIANINILRGVESSLNQEAMRIVSLMPDWTPGKINDTPVPVRVICCIPFRK